jgi:hypothetical protein
MYVIFVNTSRSFPHFMTYHRVCNQINTMGATSGAGTAYPRWGSCYSIFSFICIFCRFVCVLSSFFFGPLCSVLFRYTDSDYPFDIFKLFLFSKIENDILNQTELNEIKINDIVKYPMFRDKMKVRGDEPLLALWVYVCKSVCILLFDKSNEQSTKLENTVTWSKSKLNIMNINEEKYHQFLWADSQTRMTRNIPFSCRTQTIVAWNYPHYVWFLLPIGYFLLKWNDKTITWFIDKIHEVIDTEQTFQSERN